MPDVLAAITLDNAGVAVGVVVAVLTAAKGLSLLGPDRTAKLMENFGEALKASEGETVIWKRRAESAEPRLEELERENAVLERKIRDLGGTP